MRRFLSHSPSPTIAGRRDGESAQMPHFPACTGRMEMYIRRMFPVSLRNANLPWRCVFAMGLLCLAWDTPTAIAQPNTGMADPAALINGFDRFVAGGGGNGVVVLSLANLRGLSSEPQNAGGRV